MTGDGPARPTGGRPLDGRVALVTGVSRRIGTGMAVAKRLAGLGADLVRHLVVRARPGAAVGRRPRRHGRRSWPSCGAPPPRALVAITPTLADTLAELRGAASSGALVAITPTLADTLADQGITVNTVNPGPTDTGYADEAVRERVARRFPGGRWGAPDDVARLVAWLRTDEAAWVTGQPINSEGGFRRYG